MPVAAPPAAPPYSSAHIDWNDIYAKHGHELTRYEELVQSFETEHHIQLTRGAIEMIFVPLVEVLELGEKLDQSIVAETLRITIATVASEPDARDKDSKRSSWSVIRAFWRNFCNIPPFCGPAPEPAQGD
jgi:hypothetical protein